ncbi:phenylacetate-coenzyme A ligase PaaK-like adenylate-forming protein [Xanthobacter flavus]|uniref:Acyl--CoA ligase n=1 Tax=Xanthobacter flavus TaxID=281 RepID=A0A9W6FMX9_XANFL|nr:MULTISPECIES: AMP-binding protein [Xanthobacter]MDR6334868.1 phenylacetate-coenzyme A ligase PaaK-like adenylate-forming protein [Xanthobacter flavus]NMN60267.1 phenylacetate-coenzyme A ligase PaaK-like adenylate-forming protein [Xanthobacter sp. SG618]GLI23912.1 acyl--CoA ligase [Xanthobacter flavus]
MQHPEVESLDRDGILKLQREGLAGLGARLAQCDTWKAHFAQAGMKPEDLASEDGLANAPFMDKSLLRDLYPFPFLTVPMDKVERFVATSGTTGLPVTFGMTKNDLHSLLPSQMARLLTAAGVKPGFRAYQGYGYGLWIGGPALDAGFSAVGCTNFPIGPGRGELAARWLRDHAYDVASMSPLWLMTLVQAAKHQGINPRNDWTLKVAILGGQSVSAEFRAQLEAEMPEGFMSHNIYGTTEAGGPILAISTPFTHADDELQLLNEDTVIVEILDPKTMKPVSEGEVGEIVITTLRKEASPVVRWRTRDLVRLSPRPYDCPSGRRGMRKIGRIIGRTDDMIKFKGVIVFPSQIEDVIAGIPGLAKEAWQIYVDKEATTIGKMTVAVEAVAASQRPGEDAAADVRREIKARLGINVNVECHPEGELPRYEAKATRVLHRPEATH